jgi:hypothetical protein
VPALYTASKEGFAGVDHSPSPAEMSKEMSLGLPAAFASDLSVFPSQSGSHIRMLTERGLNSRVLQIRI